ncbi:putative ribonuclease H-like domain-containing protein [Tanacetum coccineum]
MHELEDIIYSDDDEDVGVEADMNNLDTFMPVSPIQTTRIHKDHPVEQIIDDLNSAPQTRKMTKNLEEHEEPKKVWKLVDLPNGKRAIGTKWVYRNKNDERGIVIKNKARLVAQGYTKEEGIDYDEVFAPVAKIEAIRLFLAYASFKDFVVYQMDVKSAFLYGKIEEEVYVCQPPGFEDPDLPDRVYKVEKALYGLHQAPRAWYETFSTYLFDNGFKRGKIDKTLFIRYDKGDILLVQVYVDDNIFGSTKKSLCTEFEKMMHKKFQISSIGELTFFLGLQVKQKEDGIFISQDKYATEILKKFGFIDVKTASTPMETQKTLLKDEDGEEVDVHLYRSMIGSLMYLTSSRPDIMFAVCACARYQVNPKVSHLHAVKRIFRYLKGQPKLGLWYPKDSPFDLVAYTDSDYAGASLDRKSTTGGCQFLGCRLISWQCKKQTVVANSTTEAEYVAASSCCGQVLWIQNQLLDYGDSNEKKLIQMIKIHTDKNVADLLTKAFDVKMVNGEQQLQALVDGKKIVVTEASVRRDLQLDDEEGTDCLPNATIFKELTRMGYEKLSQKLTFYNALFSPKWKFLIHTILQCLSAKTTTWNEFSNTMASAIICLATNQKFNFSKYIFESMVKNLDNTGSAMPTDPHHTPIITQPSSSQPQRKQKSRRSKRKDTEVPQPSDPTNVADEVVNEEPTSLGGQEDASKQERKIHDIDAVEDITLENVHDAEMFDVNDLHGDEVFVKKEVLVKEVSAVGKVNTASIATTVSAATITEDEITLAQALAELKSVKPKVTTTTTTATTKGILLQELSESITTTTTIIPSKDKGKGIMVEEPLQMKKKDQISFDEQEAIRLQAKFDEEAMIKTDYEKAQRLQAEEQEELTVDEKATLFQQLLEKRRKYFAAKRGEEKRNIPPIRAQQRSIMCTYLQDMAGWKPKDLKSKYFANIQELLDKTFKRMNTFVDFRTELVEGTKMEESSKRAKGSKVRAEGNETREESSSKRARYEVEQENAKKQKADDDQEATKMKELMKIVPNEEEVAVDAIPLATKPPSIGDLKTMFEHHVEDAVWRNLRESKVLVWKLFDSCGVHFMRFQNMHVYMLVETKYPLTPPTITDMFNKKLQADHWNEICYQLLKLITKYSSIN